MTTYVKYFYLPLRLFAPLALSVRREHRLNKEYTMSFAQPNGTRFEMLRSSLIALSLVLILTASFVYGQSEAELKAYFEGMKVVLKIPVPASKNGIDVHPGKKPSINFTEHSQDLRRYGTAIEENHESRVTRIRVKGKHIEFHLDGGGYDPPLFGGRYVPLHKSSREVDLETKVALTADDQQRQRLTAELDQLRRERQSEDQRREAEFKERIRKEALAAGSRFNINYDTKLTAYELSPESLMAALSGYVEFSGQQSQGILPRRAQVIQSAPKAPGTPVPQKSGLPLPSSENLPELVVQTGLHFVANDITFTKDGRWLAAANGTVVTLWEVSTGRVWRDLRGHSGKVTSIDFSPDGRWLASAGGDKNIKLWEVATGREVRTISGHTGAVRAVAFSPDGTRLASATGSVLELWDVDSGKELREFPGHTSNANSVAFSPDGTRLATAGEDGTVRIWDAGTGRSIRTLVAPNDVCRSAQFSPDGRLLAWACYHKGTVTLSETSTWSEVRTFNHGNGLSEVRFSPDGAWLASSGYDVHAKVWEVSTGKLIFQKPGYVDLAFTPDSRALVVHNFEDDLKFWEVPSGRGMQALRSATDLPSAIALDASAKWLASSGDREVKLWEMGAGRVARTVGGTDSIRSIALSSDGRLLASGGGNGIVRIRETATGREQQTFRQNGDVDAIAFSPDGRKLASAANIVSSRDISHNPADYSLKLYDTDTGRELQTLVGHTDMIKAVAFSPDGRWLASASCSAVFPDESHDDSVRLWDVATGRQLLRFSGHQRCVQAVAFSPDGRLVASGSGLFDVDNVIRVWEAATGREIRVLAGHTGSVNAVAFSPNGRQLASGGEDGQILVWDLNSGRPAHTLLGHGDTVTALLFSPTGRLLISGSRDGSVRLWNPEVQTAELALLATRKGSGDWVAATPNGLFDGSSQGMQELVAWRIGIRLYPIDRFFSDFYTPGLLARVFQGGRLDPPRALVGLKLPPEVRVTDPATGSASREPRIAVRVQAKDEGGGLTEVRLYQNGKLIETRSAAGNRNPTFTFQLNLIPGDNVLRATALSADSVESNDDSVLVTWTPPMLTGKPVLHVLVVGINLYEDARFQLRYAKQDAEAIANFFEQRGSHLFSSVKVVRLLDREASKAKILQALKRVATEAGPEDLVFIYMAGHGVSLGQQYYFLSQEMRLEESEEAAIRKYGLPATEVGDALRIMKALKQILIFDSCQSGGALPQLAKVTMFRGLQAVEEQEMDRAVKMLARANGIYLLAASTEQQYALEVPELGHGVLTYALLSGLGETGTPQAPATNGMVTILALLQYVNQQVPELTEKYHGGSKQYPVSHSTGMDFPLWAR